MDAVGVSRSVFWVRVCALAAVVAVGAALMALSAVGLLPGALVVFGSPALVAAGALASVLLFRAAVARARCAGLVRWLVPVLTAALASGLLLYAAGSFVTVVALAGGPGLVSLVAVTVGFLGLELAGLAFLGVLVVGALPDRRSPAARALP